LWDFAAQRFLLFNIGAHAYLNIATSPLYDEVMETQENISSLVTLVSADSLPNGFQTWYLKNRYGEYLLGAIEYKSFTSVLNPECSELQDYFKFIII
jgi:hypothetical protein